MKRLLVLFLLLITACKNEVSDSRKTVSNDDIKTSEQVIVDDIELEVYDYDGLEPLINQKDNNVHVVNFWATWCAPCIKELPYFEAINEKYKGKNVDVLLVSLDFPNKYDSALKPFIKKNNLKSKVVALNDTDQNRWITAIDKEWSGALPATIIYKGNKRQFYEKSFTQTELENELKQFLSP